MYSSDSEERLLAAVRTLPIEERLRREEERVRALQEIAEALRSTLNLNELLRLILAKITRLMDADRATLYLLDEETNELWSKIVQGDEVLEIRLPVGEGIAGTVAQTGRPIVLRDAYKDPRFRVDVDLRSGYRTRSVLCVPMQDKRGKLLGVIQVLNKLNGYFSPEDERLLVTLAAHAAMSIEISQLYTSVLAKNIALTEAQTQLEQKVRKLDLLYEVEQKMSTATDLDDLLEVVVAKTAEAVGAKVAFLALVEEPSGDLRFPAVHGSEKDRFSTLRLHKGQGLIGQAIESSEVFVVSDLSQDPRHDSRISLALGFSPRSCLVVPFQGEQRVVGALELLNKQDPKGFSESDAKLVTLLAGRAAQAIAAHRAREERSKASRLESMGRMLSGIVHDFKTPMTVASGYAQLIALEPDPKERERHAQTILKQLDFVNGMIRDILAFARGEHQLLIRNVLLNDFLNEMEKMLRSMLEGSAITLEFQADFRGRARFDENKLSRAIYNIARNAIQAMPQGGLLRFYAGQKDDSLLFQISDSGGGIPKEIEGKIFESFVTHGKHDGTGLGLSIVKQILEDHGGRVEYQSEPGVGTTFTLILPLEPKAS